MLMSAITGIPPVQQKDLSSVGFYSAMLPFLFLMNRQQAWMHLPLWNSEGCSKTFSSSRNRRRIIAQGTPAEIRNSFVRTTNISITVDSQGSLDQALLIRVRQVPGVTQCEFINSSNGYLTLNIKGDGNFDYLQLFRLFVDANLKVRSIENNISGLEEAFIQLTRE